MRFGPRFAVALAGWLLFGLSAHAEDSVYRYRGSDGRDVFTNAARAEVGEARPAAMALPALSLVDLSAATADQLQSLDRSVARAHEALQSSPRCDAIRASSRIPMRELLLREHPRELAVAGVLCAIALLVLVSWGGRLKPLMPLAPLLAASYIGYATYGDVDTRRSLLREGLRACSSELPAGHGTSVDTVKERLESALSLQAMVDRAYAQRSAQAEQIAQER